MLEEWKWISHCPNVPIVLEGVHDEGKMILFGSIREGLTEVMETASLPLEERVSGTRSSGKVEEVACYTLALLLLLCAPGGLLASSSGKRCCISCRLVVLIAKF